MSSPEILKDEELAQATLPVQAAMGPAVTLTYEQLQQVSYGIIREIKRQTECEVGNVGDDRYCDLNFGEGVEGLWNIVTIDLVDLAKAAVAQVTADGVPAGTRAQLETNLHSSLLSQVSVLTEALEKAIEALDLVPADLYRGATHNANFYKARADIARTALSAQGEKT